MVVGSVLVTGASTGVGEACALRLDRLGHRVYAGVRTEEHAHLLLQRGSDRIVPVFLDVTDQGQIDAAAKRIADDGGRLDGVVNNAGIARGGPLEYLPLETWREQLEVNVLGPVTVTKAVLPFIRAARGREVRQAHRGDPQGYRDARPAGREPVQGRGRGRARPVLHAPQDPLPGRNRCPGTGPASPLAT